MTIRISLDSPGFRLTFSKPFRQATGVTTLETQSRINTKAVQLNDSNAFIKAHISVLTTHSAI